MGFCMRNKLIRYSLLLSFASFNFSNAFAMDPPAVFLSAPISPASTPTLGEVTNLMAEAKAGNPEALKKCMVCYYCYGIYPTETTPEALGFLSLPGIEILCNTHDLYANFAVRFPELRKQFLQMVPSIIGRADQGIAAAQTTLGMMYSLGAGVEKNEELALKYHHLAAEQGDVQSQKALALMYAQGGESFAKNDELSYKFCKAAVDQNDPQAQYSLGMIYKSGNTYLQQDDVNALKYLQLSADQMNPYALEALAFIYREGTVSVQEDSKKAWQYLKLAAQQGLPSAQNILAYSFDAHKDPLLTTKFAIIAIVNPQTNEQTRALLLGNLLPKHIILNKDNQHNQANIHIEEITKEHFLLKHDIPQKLEYLGCCLAGQYTALELSQNDPEIQKLFGYIAESAAKMDTLVDLCFDNLKKPGFAISSIQPKDDVKTWVNNHMEQAMKIGLRGTSSEYEFCFFDSKGVTFSCIGGENPKQGFEFKHLLIAKNKALEALKTLRRMASDALDKLDKAGFDINHFTEFTHNPREQINFYDHTKAAIESVSDLFENELHRTLPLRNRAFEEENKLLFGNNQ